MPQPLAVQVEQALLGALLCDPAGQAHLLDVVERADFTRPYHGQVLAAMQRLRARGALPGPLAVHEEIKNDPDLPRRVSHDGAPLAELMTAVPRPAHAPAYAAMVIDSGIRRRIQLAATRMIQAADGHDAPAALRMAVQARRELDRCQARCNALPAPLRHQPPTPARGEGLARRLATVRAFAQHPGELDEVRFLTPTPTVPATHVPAGAGGAALAELAAVVDRDLSRLPGDQPDGCLLPGIQCPTRPNTPADTRAGRRERRGAPAARD